MASSKTRGARVSCTPTPFLYILLLRDLWVELNGELPTSSTRPVLSLLALCPSSLSECQGTSFFYVSFHIVTLQVWRWWRAPGNRWYQNSTNKVFLQMDFLTILRAEVQINEFYENVEVTLTVILNTFMWSLRKVVRPINKFLSWLDN